MKKWVLVLIFSGGMLLASADAAKPKVFHGGPDWVPPWNREQYPGYAKRVERKKNHPSWQRHTNRPGGNTRGGGTTRYEAYRSISERTGRRENRSSEKIRP